MELLIFGTQISATILAVVFVVALLLQGVIMLLVRFDRRLARSSPELTAGGDLAPPELTPELIVVIAAAATTATEKKIRIKSIRYRRQLPGTSWVVQGRAAVMASHRVKP